MAELFQKDQSVVARHINNAFKEGELDENSNMHFLHNTRYKYHPTKVYSLDVITIYTRQLSNQQQLDITRHNQQYPPITVNLCHRNHDRFLIIDDVVYLFGASLKDAGKKLPAAELLNNIK